MKNYIVHNTYPCLAYNEIFLVRANNKKEAISKTHKHYGKEFFKKDFVATEVEEYYDNGDYLGIAVIR